MLRVSNRMVFSPTYSWFGSKNGHSPNVLTPIGDSWWRKLRIAFALKKAFSCPLLMGVNVSHFNRLAFSAKYGWVWKKEREPPPPTHQRAQATVGGLNCDSPSFMKRCFLSTPFEVANVPNV